MQSAYKSNYLKKRQMTSNNLKRPKMTAKEPVIDSVKSNRKSKIKGGKSIDDNTSIGRNRIEQAFSSSLMAEFIEII